MKGIVVFYHSGCQDGFGAAWAAWKKFGNRATYIPLRHADGVPKELKKKEVYLLDITFFGDTLKKVVKDNTSVTILDHHATAKNEIKKATIWKYGTTSSGAGLSWKFFHPDQKTPRLIAYVEAQDLWRFTLPHTKEFNAVIESLPFDFQIWSKAAKELENAKKRKDYLVRGRAMLTAESALVRSIVKNAEDAKILGHRARVVNCPILESSVGHALYRGEKKVVAVMWARKSGRIKVSLRSDGSPDVSKIAKHFGGGGHKAASGFSLKIGRSLPWKYSKK